MRFFAAIAIATLSALPASANQAEVDATDGERDLGKLPCAQLAGQTVSNCPFEALRKPDGTATLRVLLPDQSVRYIYFEAGKPTGTDSTDPISTDMQGDTLLIYVGPTERFEVPSSLVISE